MVWDNLGFPKISRISMNLYEWPCDLFCDFLFDFGSGCRRVLELSEY